MLYTALALIVAFTCTEGAEWNYDPNSDYGVNNWGKKFPQCSSSENYRQSPIDIKHGSLTYDNETLKPLELTNFRSKDVTFLVENNGHTLQYNVLDGTMITRGGPLGEDSYHAAQFHLHWGHPGAGGSEHTVLEERYAAEMHIVHLNYKHMKLPISEILKKPDGAAVIGIFIEVAEDDDTPNAEFSKVVAGAENVTGQAMKKENMTRGYLNVEKLLPEDLTKYYTYLGGLTTPNCDGAVTWIVMKNPISVNKGDLEALYNVTGKDGEPIRDNFRPTQAVGNRVVRSSFKEGAAGGLTPTPMIVLFALGLFLYKYVE